MKLTPKEQDRLTIFTLIVGKKDMRFNNAMPLVHVHLVTHEVTINGARVGMEHMTKVPLSRLYIVS